MRASSFEGLTSLTAPSPLKHASPGILEFRYDARSPAFCTPKLSEFRRCAPSVLMKYPPSPSITTLAGPTNPDRRHRQPTRAPTPSQPSHRVMTSPQSPQFGEGSTGVTRTGFAQIPLVAGPTSKPPSAAVNQNPPQQFPPFFRSHSPPPTLRISIGTKEVSVGWHDHTRHTHTKINHSSLHSDRAAVKGSSPAAPLTKMNALRATAKMQSRSNRRRERR